ncbi:major facilitator superfamily domain-containing protein [Cladochytrium replicatum]|nr:major facilitator superfamily domain-containing protein [Cladochytrium replicatum]
MAEAVARKAHVLNQLDTAKFSSAHVRAILVAGSGFLTDSYDNFVIGLVVPMIAVIYFGATNYKLPLFVQDGMVKAASSIGNLVGQIAFGVMGDILGRKRMYGIELIILIVGAVGSALSASPKAGIDILGVLGFWRFILGIGVGGDYPVSAIITSEFAASKYRGTMIATVFAMQGVGQLLGAIVGIISVAAFKDAIIANHNNLDYVWRILLGFGAVPALLAVYYRLTIPETPRFALDVLEDVERSALAANNFVGAGVSVDKADTAYARQEVSVAKKYGQAFKAYFGKWKNARTLIATSMTWFLLDIGFYGTNLNTSSVLGYIGYGDSKDPADFPFQGIWARVVGNAIVNLCGNLPGYFFTVGFIDIWGRKPIQYMGFAMLTILFAILAGAYDVLKANSQAGFVVVYAVAQFFFNFGPNTTTFIIPAECFPTQVRSSAHGISAASGKAGAIIAALGFQWIASNTAGGLQTCLWIFAACNLGGLIFTYWVPETKGKTLEELSEEFERDTRELYDTSATVVAGDAATKEELKEEKAAEETA